MKDHCTGVYTPLFVVPVLIFKISDSVTMLSPCTIILYKVYICALRYMQFNHSSGTFVVKHTGTLDVTVPCSGHLE